MGNPLFATKSLDTLMKEASDTGEHSLKRALGPVNLVTLGIGAIIGAGIFVLTGSAASLYAGPAIMLSWRSKSRWSVCVRIWRMSCVARSTVTSCPASAH